MGITEVGIFKVLVCELFTHNTLKNRECIWDCFMSFVNKLKSFSRLVNRPTDTNLRLVITEEDNITNDC